MIVSRLFYIFLLALLCLTPVPMSAQLLIMDFNSDATGTVVGSTPNSISASAGSIAGGANGNGLAASRNGSVAKRDIDMTFNNTGNYWDVSGIELSIAYQREENDGWFFTRLGNNLRFGSSGGNLQVRYEVSDGVGGSNTVNSGNIQGIPNDDTWRVYSFSYDPNTGVGAVYVDSSLVWSNDGPDNRPMYWNGAGNFRIGDMMDASGNVEAIFDDIFVSSISVLPVEFIEFVAQRNEESVDIQWATATETDNDFFEIERSIDGENWESILTINGAGRSNSRIDYMEKDYEAPKTDLFYRVKQIDFNGVFDYSNQVFVPYLSEKDNGEEVIFQTFPNPVERGNRLNLVFENLKNQDLLLVLRDVNGKEMYMKTMYIKEDNVYEVIDINATIPAGNYIITATSDDRVFNNKLIIR